MRLFNDEDIDSDPYSPKLFFQRFNERKVRFGSLFNAEERD